MAGRPWAELEQELNQRQREAVFTSAPHCLVLAGPGTGKTRTLVNRIIYLNKMAGIPPSQILALTFTRKAATVMTERLSRHLGQAAAEVSAGTFHQLAVRLLRENPQAVGLPEDFVVADEQRQIRTLKRAWHRLKLSSDDPGDKQMRTLTGLFGRHRADQSAGLLSSLQSDLFAEYISLLRSEGSVDFDDLLDLARSLLTNKKSLREQLRQRWPQVLVDEFQDTDTLQYRIFRLLVPKDGSSFVVADDKQSIYAWRGADPRNILHYRNDYSPTEIFLNENYRNRSNILTAARTVLGDSGEALESRAGGKGEVLIEQFENEEDEAAFLAAYLKQERARHPDLHWRDMAILYPKHAIGEYLESRLMAERVPVELASGRAILEQPRIRQMIALLSIMRNPNDDLAFEQVLGNRLEPPAMSELRRLAGRGKTSWKRAVSALLRQRAALENQARAWGRFSQEAEGLDEQSWLSAFADRFPDGLSSFLFPDRGDRTRAEQTDRGRRLTLVARLPRILDEQIARISNLRAGRRGKTLSQLVREILLELAGSDERETLPGDPADDPSLVRMLDAIRGDLQKGRFLQISAEDAKQEALFAEILQQGLEPWLRPLIRAGGAEPVAGPILKADSGASRISLTGEGESIDVKGPPALLVFRLYQLWRAADHLPLQDYVVFDLETTGREAATCEIVEIAAIRFRGGKEAGRFESLVKPEGKIPAQVQKVHGISDEMVADAPEPRKVLTDFFDFVGDHDLVAHNGIGFDFPILSRYCRALGLPRPQQAIFDTLALARRLYPRERNRLADLIERFDIKAEARHRALDDCRCLGEAFAHMQARHLSGLRRNVGREVLAPLALAFYLDPLGAPEKEDKAAFAIFRAGVRRLLSAGSDWIQAVMGEDAPPDLRGDLLRLSDLESEAPELFTGLRSEEERFLDLVPAYDELFLGESIVSFLDFLALYQTADFSSGSNAVQLMTIHAAKGLEFRKVVIVGLEESNLPGYYALKAEGDESVEEERRVLYVAMTRAGDTLLLSRTRNRSGYPREDSRFLHPLLEKDS